MVSKRQKAISEAGWEEGFSSLRAFKRQYGHCLVPRWHMQGKYKLGQWVAVQRYRKAKLSSERKKRLDDIGFVWNWRDLLWEKNFAALKAFKDRYGHCLVPVKYAGNGKYKLGLRVTPRGRKYKLGLWVTTQRRNRSRMSKERRQRLEAIGFVWQQKMGPKKDAKS